ncbi:hypothetical protein CPter91_4198 [Collimonas pratensis]|uniref:Uncharacterized protein n=1 Tax=Collimonas pratensis TaxID=279113 RepID=A0A127Q8Z0_9BURK|nr:hypothetical protein CPter91_4198 [Collimonas pratensis]
MNENMAMNAANLAELRAYEDSRSQWAFCRRQILNQPTATKSH